MFQIVLKFSVSKKKEKVKDYAWVSTHVNSAGGQVKCYGKSAREYVLDAARLSGILKAKQKLGVTFNFDKPDVIDFTKFS